MNLLHPNVASFSRHLQFCIDELQRTATPRSEAAHNRRRVELRAIKARVEALQSQNLANEPMRIALRELATEAGIGTEWQPPVTN